MDWFDSKIPNSYRTVFPFSPPLSPWMYVVDVWVFMFHGTLVEVRRKPQV